MSVQSDIQLYQTPEGLGVINQSNPCDIGAYIAKESGIKLGRLVCKSSATPKGIVLANDATVLIGATVKTQDRTNGVNRGIVKSTSKNSDQSFQVELEKPLPIARMGYVNLYTETAVSPYDELYTRVANNNTVGDLGNVATGKDSDTDWLAVTEAAFIGEASEAGAVEVFLDMRLPALAGGALGNVWVTS